MSIKIDHVNVEPGDHFFVNWRGSAEESIAISTWENGKIMVSGPMNCNSRRFMFSKGGVEEMDKGPNVPRPAGPLGDSHQKSQNYAQSAEHRARHQLLHKHLDKLIADMRKHKKKNYFMAKTTVAELWAWSHEQTLKPMED